MSAIDTTMPAAAERPTAPAEDHALWKPRVNPWLIAMTVALAAFMEVLDTTIANVALPHIAGSLGASEDQSTWVLTSYLVSNAIVLPLGGWASNLMGRRNFFVFCILVFTAASFLCGIAPSLPLLLVFRVIQGAGGGGLQPMAQAIMADSFEPQQRGQAFALYGLVAVLAPSIGPTLGGWITDNFSWRWIFFMNIPVGIMAFILVTRMVEDPPWIKPDRSRLRHMDYLGLSFLALAMGAMQIMLDKGEENDWFSSDFIRLFAFLFIAGMLGLVIWEWRQKNPLINLKLFRFRNFAICCFLMMLVGGVLNANTVLQPQFTQELLGYNATTAGLALTAGGIALVVVMPLAGWATGKFSARTLTVIGFTLFVITFRYAAAVTNLQMSFAEASWLRVVQMLPIPFCFISITNAAYVGMPKEESNQVAGLINFVRNIGRQHSHRRHQRAGDHARHVARAALAAGHATRLHRLRTAPAGAVGVLRRQLRRRQRQSPWRWARSTTSSSSRLRRRATRTFTWNSRGCRWCSSRWLSCSAKTAPAPDPARERCTENSASAPGSLRFRSGLAPRPQSLWPCVALRCCAKEHSSSCNFRPIMRGRILNRHRDACSLTSVAEEAVMLKSILLLFAGVVFAVAPRAVLASGPQEPGNTPENPAPAAAPAPAQAAAPAAAANETPAATPAAAGAALPMPVDATNPVKPTADSLAKAKNIYGFDCALCHGDTGNGKSDLATSMGLTLDDWTNPKTLADKRDGALFDTIRAGKDKMPPEDKSRASDTEVWNLIHYIRSFSKSGTATPVAAAK